MRKECDGKLAREEEPEDPALRYDEHFGEVHRFAKDMNQMIEKVLRDIRELKKSVDSLYSKPRIEDGDSDER